MTRPRPAAALISIVLAAASAASAEDNAAPAGFTLLSERLQPEPAPAALPPAPDAWRVELSLWAWITSVDGTAGVGPQTAEVSADFGDVLEGSDSIFAFAGRLEVGRGRWGGFIDGWYAKIGIDDQSGPAGATDIDVTFTSAIANAGAMYRVAEWTPQGAAAANARPAAIDLYAGLRFTSIDLELDPALLPSRGRTENWADPIIGGRAILPFAERWFAVVDGDIGGFGVGSDLTWSISAVLGGDITIFGQPATLYAGYRAIGWDYSDGSGPDRFEWDMIQHGPLLGLGLRF